MPYSELPKLEMLMRSEGTLEVIPALIHKTKYVEISILLEHVIEFVLVQDGRTALYYAAWNGHTHVVSLLVEAHADLNLPKKVYNVCAYVFDHNSSCYIRRDCQCNVFKLYYGLGK